jgi:hypothetical protein
MGGAYGTYGGEGMIHILVAKSWGKETTWKTRRRWEGNIEMDLEQMEWEGMDWICFEMGISFGLLWTR